jgi:hypothetical protein
MPDISRYFIRHFTPEDETMTQIQNFAYPLPRDKVEYSGIETSMALLRKSNNSKFHECVHDKIKS